MTKEEYREYLVSDHWFAFRDYVFSKKGYRCELCRATECIELHHLTYARLGHERIEDVRPLCRLHHRQQHFGVAPVYHPSWPTRIYRAFLWLYRKGMSWTRRALLTPEDVHIAITGLVNYQQFLETNEVITENGNRIKRKDRYPERYKEVKETVIRLRRVKLYMEKTPPGKSIELVKSL